MLKAPHVAALAASLVMLAGCLGFGDDAVELTFVDHVKAGMIEQDVFVEKVPGSGLVFRVDKNEAARYAGAPIYRTAIPVRHAPYSPQNNGPYPKGASLGMSLGDWLRAKGKLRYRCSRGTGRVEAVFKDLVPNGTYSMWYFRAAKAHMGCAACRFATFDLPVGATDGSQSPTRRATRHTTSRSSPASIRATTGSPRRWTSPITRTATPMARVRVTRAAGPTSI